jgi:hypothetical protein
MRQLVWFGLLYALGVIAFGAATLGLRRVIGFFVPPGAHAAVLPSALTKAAPSSGTPSSGPASPGPAPSGPAPSGPARAAPAKAAADAPGGRAGFDIVRIAPDGSAVIAGHAPADATVAVTLDGRLLGTAHADGSGSWLLLPRQRLRQGRLALAVGIVAPGWHPGRRPGKPAAAIPGPAPAPAAGGGR